jgi:AcrR family transcriptional regulator
MLASLPRRAPRARRRPAAPARTAFVSRHGSLTPSERSYYSRDMPKGAETRRTILDHALQVATKEGLEGLTIGRLAQDLQLSKSGLFAHFRGKEELLLQVLQTARARFIEQVVKPGLAAPRGEPRIRALFESWLAWERSSALPGGCPFIQAAVELDDRSGPARDFLVQAQRDWLDVIANSARTGIQEGQFRPDFDTDQFAYDLHGAMLSYHHVARLLRDPSAETRVRRAFESLLDRARRPGRVSR